MVNALRPFRQAQGRDAEKTVELCGSPRSAPEPAEGSEQDSQGSPESVIIRENLRKKFLEE
ncbi:MAG: hypothetical protein DRI57_15440 [Deltaproteobacteria bacterium]|nr:MAG: hypothetical protein DRI57_15440 [Deltaproteobacteria bacterium]